MNTRKTPAERFHDFAVNCGTNEDDASLARAVEALQKLQVGEATPEEVDTAVDPLFEAWCKAAREAPQPSAVAIAANSMKTAPLREWATTGGVAESDPLLTRALKAQERADWRTSWESWQEMEIAAVAFLRTHFEFKDAWPPQA